MSHGIEFAKLSRAIVHALRGKYTLYNF
ncbi:hypothetical protein [Methanosarcina barkeri]